MILKADNLIKKYKARTVVDNVSVYVNQGEIVGLLGPNGAGKTTTFYMIVGLIKPNQGQIFLNDEDITALPMYRRAPPPTRASSPTAATRCRSGWRRASRASPPSRSAPARADG